MAVKYRTPVKTLAVLGPRAVRILADHETRLAVRLGAMLGVGGDRENQRRVARDVVKYARNELGERICANLTVGYWLARSHTEWERYTAVVKARGVFEFVRVRRMDAAISERNSGQGMLFERGKTTQWATR